MLGLPANTLVALELHRGRQAELCAQFGSDYRTDLDLIFANPDGTPLRPDSISGVCVGAIQTPENSEAERRRSPFVTAQPRFAYAGPRCPASSGFATSGAFLSEGYG